MNTNTLRLQKKIMRRVYFIFAKRLIMHPVTMQLATSGLALVVVAKLVHVHRVIETLTSASLTHLPAQAFNIVSTAFMRGEVLTLIAVGTLVFTALSIPRHVLKARLPVSHTLVTTKV